MKANSQLLADLFREELTIKTLKMLAMTEPPLVSFMVLVATEMTRGINTLKRLPESFEMKKMQGWIKIETSPEPCQTSNRELFAKIVNDFSG